VYDRLTTNGISKQASAGDDIFDNVAGSSSAEDGLVIDPRIFNDTTVRRANVPGANMHFTAQALATIYASVSGCATVTQLLPPSYLEMLQKEVRAAKRSLWPLGFRAYRLGKGEVGFGFNGLWNCTGFSVRERGGLALAVLVNTYTPDAVAAKSVLRHVLRSRGYGEMDMEKHGLGGVSLAED